MKWPWSKPENRAASSSYTDALIAAIVSGSGGSASGVPTATAALEAAAGFVGRAFASAEVKPDDTRALSVDAGVDRA